MNWAKAASAEAWACLAWYCRIPLRLERKGCDDMVSLGPAQGRTKMLGTECRGREGLTLLGPAGDAVTRRSCWMELSRST